MNKRTRETTWTKPAGYGGTAAGAAAGAGGGGGSGVAAAAAAAQWKESVDPSSGRTFYTNTQTRQTTWERPPELGGAGAAAGAGSGAGGGGGGGGGAGPWQERKDPSSGKTYYVNTATRETSWSRPPGMVGGGPAASAAGAVGGGASASDWVETMDPTKGKPYFYNKKTRQTTWQRPAELGR